MIRYSLLMAVSLALMLLGVAAQSVWPQTRVVCGVSNFPASCASR